jgi:hypothetical protein
MFAKHPELAKEYAVKGKAFQKLPEHVKATKRAEKKARGK